MYKLVLVPIHRHCIKCSQGSGASFLAPPKQLQNPMQPTRALEQDLRPLLHLISSTLWQSQLAMPDKHVFFLIVVNPIINHPQFHYTWVAYVGICWHKASIIEVLSGFQSDG